MDQRASIPRCVGIWAGVTTAVSALLAWLAGDLARAFDLVESGDPAAASFEDLLAMLAALAVAICALWFWLVTTVVSLEAGRGATLSTSPSTAVGCPEGLRRLLWAGCGLALASGLTAPAAAVDGQQHRPPSGSAVLTGLPLPERPSVHASSDHPAADPPQADSPAAHPAVQRVATVAAPQTVEVRAGDNLWDLAASILGPGAEDTEIATTWRAIYAHNQDVIGDDPDLILPGTTLKIPSIQEESR
jgi:hypothetical protein